MGRDLADNAIREYDKNGDGTLDDEEFSPCSELYGREYRYEFGEKSVRNDFKHFDKDKSKYLDAEETGTWLNRNFVAGIGAKFLEIATNSGDGKASLEDLRLARAKLIRAYVRHGGVEL